ncbi:MAG: SGNH/GDSL hydrolase family protein [Bacteroidia bacterium]|nr:SGNH/GDSL hydrolase family protein [Bacteroidia bacterium]
MLPFGSSNTGGQGTGSDPRLFAYRKGLQDELGVGSYDLVGDFTDPDTDDTYDVDHDGIGGQTTAELETRLPGELTQYMSQYVSGDVVILDMGTNDSCLDSTEDREGARDNFEDMIDIVYAFNPNIKIIATIAGPVKTATSSCIVAPAYADVQTWHDITLTMLLAKQASVPTLYIYDLNAHVDSGDNGCGNGSNGDDCLFDTAHFTETGYYINGEWIAEAILDCQESNYCYSL